MKQIILLLAIVALCSADFASDCLDAQNSFRSQVGVSGLTWADDLASSAQSAADSIASSGDFTHSASDGIGENLAAGSSDLGVSGLIGMWGDEGNHFIDGCTFPDCSDTGSWDAVGHYTQMVWAATTEVGCALSSGDDGMDYLVCQYRPQGNEEGQSVY